ncbi:MAG: hypothetical protein RLZZ444_3457 [Pseudomonadota bacterium]|jgi:hypothetical protein
MSRLLIIDAALCAVASKNHIGDITGATKPVHLINPR